MSGEIGSRLLHAVVESGSAVNGNLKCEIAEYQEVIFEFIGEGSSLVGCGASFHLPDSVRLVREICPPVKVICFVIGISSSSM